MSIFEKYFDIEFNQIKYEHKNIKEILTDNMTLISGDFYGIQKFIFENLSAKNASKVLRAKSAYVQIITEYVAKYICYKFDLDEKYILTKKAGKFEILATNFNDHIFKEIQRNINIYFIKNFYGLSGINICAITCNKDDFENSEKYRQLRTNIANFIEAKKYNKFNLQELENNVLAYDETINNQTLCKICNIRKITSENCNICNAFKKLGEILVSDKKLEIIQSEEVYLEIDGFKTAIELDEKIKSYVLTEGKSPADFETLANNSCKGLDTGMKSLAILKADVDNMGNFIKNTDVTENFENFDVFSNSLDMFFSIYVPKLMKEKYPNTYTVFAGGDDLFLVGAWDEILELSRRIQNDFKKFIKYKLSISFGLSISKPNTPISYLAHSTEEQLEKSKLVDENKDALTIFNLTVKWEDYLKTFKIINETLSQIEGKGINTVFLHRLLDLCDMSIRLKVKENLEDAMWKSKLNYSFARNMNQKHIKILSILDESIEKYPKETKITLSEFIYKRRTV